MQRNLRWLQHPDKPTTAPIGTDRLRAAVRALACRHNAHMHARTFLGRRPGAIHHVQASDSPDAISGQWAALVATLCSPDDVLLYHLENHYSIVYAAREWACGGNVSDGIAGASLVRQVLVGKPGQQPNRWIAFEDVRACVLGWHGYAVVCIHRDCD